MQMQDKQSQPQSRPPMKFATASDYITLYAADLLQMKAQGKSNGEMLSYLRTRGIITNMGEIAAFWQHHPENQKQQQNQPEPSSNPSVGLPVGHGFNDGRSAEPPAVNSAKTASEILNLQFQIFAKPPVVDSAKAAQSTDLSAIAQRATAEASAKVDGTTASVPPQLLEFVIELVDLRAAGKSDAELLAWLRTNKNLYVNSGELAKVFEYYKEYQQEIEEELEQATERDPEPDAGQPHDQEKDQSKGNPSRTAEPPTVNSAKAAQSTDLSAIAQRATAEASAKVDGTTASAEYDISEVMADYKVLVARQVAKDKATPAPNLESQKVTERMVRTLMMYKHSLERREERLAALKIKQAEHERKKSKAATQEEARKTVTDRKAPKDFGNTANLSTLNAQLSTRSNPADEPSALATADLSGILSTVASAKEEAQRATPDLSSVASAKEDADLSTLTPQLSTKFNPSG